MLPEQTTAALAARLDRAWPGSPFPLGATWDGEGTNFALWSSTATGVCGLPVRRATAPRPASRSTTRPTRSGTATCPASAPASATASGSTGRTTRRAGLFHNPAKLLVDPYARAIEGDVRRRPGGATPTTTCDSAPFVPRSVVVHDAFPWGDDRRPRVPWDDTVIYELHVRGFTEQHPGIPEELRGTYAGLAHPAAIDYLHRPRRHRGRAAAGPPVRLRAAPAARAG